VLYGMIGLLGAKIWIEGRVDFGNPVNLMPVGAGLILAIGPVTHYITGDFEIGGIAFGTIVVLIGYHALRALAPAYLKDTERPVGDGEPTGGAERSARRTNRRRGTK
jgi:xanthine/uracil permease